VNDVVRRELALWVGSWDESLTYDAGQLEALVKDLEVIACCSRGRVVDDDGYADWGAVARFAVMAAGEGIRAVLTRCAREVSPGEGEYVKGAVDEGLDCSLTFVEGRCYRPLNRVDLNLAAVEELAALPGLGPVTARRLVACRRRWGGIRQLEDVLRVKGISRRSLERFAPLVRLGPEERRAGLSTDALRAFRRDPCMPTFIALLRELDGGISVARPLPPRAGGDVAGWVVEEVRRIAELASRRPAPGAGPEGFLPAELARRAVARADRARELAGQAVTDASAVCLLDDTAYVEFVLRLLQGAQQRIRVTMFFMAGGGPKRHPADKFLEELARAAARGVDVRVILDIDRDDDVYGSRYINRAAHDYLAAHGVRVVFDRPERLTHSKVICVDGRCAVVGSHNWTAGSFYLYDDKSLFVESPAVVERLCGRFDELWREYGGQ